MLLHVIAAVASIAFVAQGALAQQQTIQDIVNNIDQVTQIAENANTELSAITPLSPLSQVQTSAQNLQAGLNVIAQNINSETSKIQVTTPFSDCTATEPVVIALSNVRSNPIIHYYASHLCSVDAFVGALQQLLDIVIAKQTSFAQFVSLIPIGTALKNLKTAIDSSANPMINLLPTCNANIVINDQNELDNTLGNAIKLYGQLCIPSPDHPTIRPICTSI